MAFQFLSDYFKKKIPLEQHQYIFIVSCYNSGSTLLNHILSHHPEISGLQTEGVNLTNELKAPEDFNWNRLWHKCQEKLEIRQLDRKPNPEVVKNDWFKHFNPKKEFFLEKSIINSLNIDWFEQCFNSPYFIWIIRNGYCVAEGIQRRTIQKDRIDHLKGTPYSIEDCFKQWVINNNVISEKIRHTKNHYKLTYEDLTDDFTETLEQLIGWLPVQNKKLIKPKKFEFHKSKKPISNQNPNSFKRISNEDIKKINDYGAHHLKQWGYPVIDRS